MFFIKYYSQGVQKRRPKEDEHHHLLDLERFDKNDPVQFTTKVQVICSDCFDFCGIEEHTMLMTTHLETSKFPPKHMFSKYEWIGFHGMAYKNHRLSMNRGILNNSHHWRIPVIDPNCLTESGGTLVRYRDA